MGKEVVSIGKMITWPVAIILDISLAIMSNCTFIGCFQDKSPVSVNKVVVICISASCAMITSCFINAAITYFSQVTEHLQQMKLSWIRNAKKLKRHERLSLLSYKPTIIQVSNCYKLAKITGLTLTFTIVEYTGEALIAFRHA